MKKKLLAALVAAMAIMVPSMGAMAADENEVIETKTVTYNDLELVEEEPDYAVASSVPGLVAMPDGTFALFSNGTFIPYTGLYQDPAYGWVLIGNGYFCPTYDDFWCDPVVGWWKVSNGFIDFSYTGWYNSPSVGNWYVSGGMLDFATSQAGTTTTTTTACDAPQLLGTYYGNFADENGLQECTVAVESLGGSNYRLTAVAHVGDWDSNRECAMNVRVVTLVRDFSINNPDLVYHILGASDYSFQDYDSWSPTGTPFIEYFVWDPEENYYWCWINSNGENAGRWSYAMTKLN